MMISKAGFAIALVAVAAVIPTSSRPRTKRLSRGPAFTQNLDQMKIDQEDLRDAEKLRTQYRRVSILATNAEDSELRDVAGVAADVIATGLSYGTDLIVVDDLSNERVFGSSDDRSQWNDAAKSHGIDLLVLVEIQSEPKRLQVEIVPAASDVTVQTVAPIPLDDLSDEVVTAAVKARSQTLAELSSSAGKHVAQLDRMPQGNLEALKHLRSARQTLARAVLIDDDQQREKVVRQSLEHAEKALEASPRLLEASIVKATCLDELNEKEQVEATLRGGRRVLDRSQHDLLAQMELMADYARFVRTDPIESLESYDEMLQVSPTSLTGLWAMIDILLTGDGTAPIAPADMDLAEKYGAMIVALHPDCGVAEVLK